ncbi:hypothetical protein SBY92_002887 [Candida maltosa Xu316]
MKSYWVFIFLLVHVFGTKTDTSTTSVDPTPTPSTIVDILSSQPQFSYFLRLLQRQGMIPLINQLENVTVLAPINSAFVGQRGIDWENNDLKRYIVNQKLRIGYLDKEESVYKTLYRVGNQNYSVSIRPDLESLEYVIDGVSSIVDQDIYAKHQYSYIQGIDHLLPIKPTLCDALMNDSNSDIALFKKIFQSLFVDPDLETEGKKKRKKKKKPKKEKPRPLPNSCEELLNGTQTIIIPNNNLLKKSLSDIQLKYYLANDDLENFATTADAITEIKYDVMELLENLMFNELIVGKNITNSKVVSKSGVQHKFSLKNRQVKVDNIVANSTIVLADGAVHIFNEDSKVFFQNINVPTVEMIARKALYGLHYSSFVEEIYFRTLDHLIDGTTSNQSIFVDIEDRDDVEEENFSRQNLLYQFTDGTPDTSTRRHVLMNTKLCSDKKIGGCYKLKLSTSNSNKNVTVNDDVDVTDFIPIANDTTIYIATGEIKPPVNLKHALGDLISSGTIPRHLESIQIDRTSCLKTLEFINSFDLYSLDDNEKGYSIFLPCGTKNLWKDLGLVLTYLENNPNVLQKIINGMFLKNLVYSDFAAKKEIFKDINGTPIHVSSLKIKDDKNIISLNQTELALSLNSDVLFSQGVIHVVDEVLLPDNFEIPIEELIRTTFDANFPNHFIWEILKMYPNIKNAIIGKTPYSLLIPTPESLKDFNITSSFDDLLRFVDFHLIPNTEVSKILDCIDGVGYNDSIIKTNLSEGGLVCKHKPNTNKVLLQLHKLNTTVDEAAYNKDHEVRILNHGCTKQYRGDTDHLSCVFYIQKPLSLQWLENPKKDDNFLHVHLGLVSVGAGVILGLILFGGVMAGLVLCLGKRDKNDDKDDIEFPRADSGFMSVLTDEDEFIPYDRGYETDVDVLRTESDALLPIHMKRKKRIRKPDYGSTKNNNNNGTTLPRDIGDVRNTLNRERNGNGYTQF